MQSNDYLLRLSLRSNAVFCGVCAVGMCLGADRLGGFLGVNGAAVFTVGGLLALYAPLLYWRGSRQPIALAEARLAIAADLGWVAASAVLLGTGAFSGPGAWLVVAVADVVLVFALLQYLGLRRVRGVSVPA